MHDMYGKDLFGAHDTSSYTGQGESLAATEEFIAKSLL